MFETCMGGEWKVGIKAWLAEQRKGRHSEWEDREHHNRP